MADDDRLKILEDRLTRLEAVLTQRPPTGVGGGTPPGGGVVVDPAPWGGGGGAWQFHPRPFPTPVVDPAPWWMGGWGRTRWPWPTPVVDPGRGRLLSWIPRRGATSGPRSIRDCPPWPLDAWARLAIHRRSTSARCRSHSSNPRSIASTPNERGWIRSRRQSSSRWRE
jgi:hypothetical protein